MSQFVVKKFSVSKDYDYIDSITSLGDSVQIVGVTNPLQHIGLEIYPCATSDDSARIFFKDIRVGKVITILTADYSAWVEPFKEEFKQFLIERHPEEIVKNQTGFSELFGTDTKGII